ncbi:MAG: saccharopine dehydrogenase NADP-binding domain-containing protein [Bryobacteraceae bacterium]|nr:saccharopine dehydrogenase NADP-binding domain-containing protein [Bryobacterales bacterium]NUN01258.1 saccharopine dehydrogenase NADP-binding domain-containing protein [Bryobacteraceae bacterium]
MHRVDFDNRIVVTGFGAVAQSVLPILLKHLRVSPPNITVVDFNYRGQAFQPWLARGVRFIQERVTPDNLHRILSSNVGRGGLIIDLAWSIDFFDIAQWSHDNEVLYVNASLESWDATPDLRATSLIDRSLYRRYVGVLDMAGRWRNDTTAVIDQGANPGLISAFVKKGLLDIAGRAAGETTLSAAQRHELEWLLERKDFARLAKELGVKVIHCSERDTQRSAHPKSAGEFVGTWSVEGMWEECVAPCELGWGTHEKSLPANVLVPGIGPANMVILPRFGMDTFIRSWVPEREILGMAIAHGECFSLSHALTVKSATSQLYRPTVAYAYVPCPASLQSLEELRSRNYKLHPVRRILTEDIVEGADTMGALIMGHRYQSWWTGSSLSIEGARQSVPGGNATTLQVAAGVVAAVLWAVQNPHKGIRFSEDLPHEEMLRTAAPYIGSIQSDAVAWSPAAESSDPWQFDNFVRFSREDALPQPAAVFSAAGGRYSVLTRG